MTGLRTVRGHLLGQGEVEWHAVLVEFLRRVEYVHLVNEGAAPGAPHLPV